MGDDFKMADAVIEGRIADQMKKLYTKKSEQYDGFPPIINPSFMIWKGYPACRHHGHLTSYAWEVWRCIECGWAVTIHIGRELK